MLNIDGMRNPDGSLNVGWSGRNQLEDDAISNTIFVDYQQLADHLTTVYKELYPEDTEFKNYEDFVGAYVAHAFEYGHVIPLVEEAVLAAIRFFSAEHNIPWGTDYTVDEKATLKRLISAATALENQDDNNAGYSTCPVCNTVWLVTPERDCFMPGCGCYGDDTSRNNPHRLCYHCGYRHAIRCMGL